MEHNSQVISPQEANDIINKNLKNSNLVILDIRTHDEFSAYRIENSVNLDYYSKDFRDELEKLDKDKIYLIYCARGIRTLDTFDIMMELGFSKVYDIEGGIKKWRLAGLKIIE